MPPESLEEFVKQLVDRKNRGELTPSQFEAEYARAVESSRRWVDGRRARDHLDPRRDGFDY